MLSLRTIGCNITALLEIFKSDGHDKRSLLITEVGTDRVAPSIQHGYKAGPSTVHHTTDGRLRRCGTICALIDISVVCLTFSKPKIEHTNPTIGTRRSSQNAVSRAGRLFLKSQSGIGDARPSRMSPVTGNKKNSSKPGVKSIGQRKNSPQPEWGSAQRSGNVWWLEL